MLAVFLAGVLAGPAPGQGGQGQAVGHLRAAGEVYVNQTGVAGERTVFAGDTVRTNSDGRASILVGGRGVLELESNSRLVLAAAPQYFAWLEEGKLTLRALQDARNFQLRLGRFILVPSPETESAAQMEQRADGAARVRCVAGSIGLVALEGVESLFLNPEQVVDITREGQLRRPPPQEVPTPPLEPVGEKKSRRGLVILILVGAAGGGAAVALASRGRESVSPSVP